ncbi:MAG: YitT family protein [Chloroflexota bacterium]|nr:YitT family protein [Chloroflexota bacterium]
MAGVAVVYAALVLLAVAAGLSRTWEGVPEFLRRVGGPLVPPPRRKERLATIVTTEGQAVASRILQELGRGVTALEGRGMYSGASWDVLLSAVTDVQVPYLKEIVHEADPDAFVVVSMAAEVRGGGFAPFEPPS